MTLIIYRGNDEKITLKFYQDDDKTQPISIDAMTDLQIRIAIGNTILGQWNKDGSGDFTALTRVDAYEYYLWFVTDETTKIGTADMWIEIIDDESELPDNLQNTVRASLLIYNIQDKPY